MTDLVDYLRDKLEHADDPVCLCDQVDVGWPWAPEWMRGRTNPHCPIHALIKPSQHCTADCDYTHSHTARWCGRPQLRRCPCGYCYPEERQ